MKIFYLNDETRPVTVQVNAQDGIYYVVLKPQEARVFDFVAPENAIPWIKKWDYAVILLSYADPESLSHTQHSSLRGGS